jgi:DNA primase catalytic core
MPSRYRRPATPAERARAAADREQRLAVLHDQLREQLSALVEGPAWRAWLATAAKFRTYSFHNTLLIGLQRPDATAVAGYKVWQQLGRQVNKGEKGIMLLAPVLRRQQSDDDAETGKQPDVEGTGSAELDGRRLVGFTSAYVWDISQTSGAELPAPVLPALLAGHAPAGLWDALATGLHKHGYTVSRGQPSTPAANGVTTFSNRSVVIRADVDEAQAVKTLAHEYGHVLLHDPALFPNGQTASCRGDAEVEAESVAYLVAACHGLDTGGYSFAYVAHWAEGRDLATVMASTGPRILAATNTILDVAQPITVRMDDSATASATLLSRALEERVRSGAAWVAGLRADVETSYEAALAHDASAEGRAAPDVGTLARAQHDAAEFYAARYPGSWAARYLAERLGEDLITDPRWQLGYAPPGWTGLTDHLRVRGYSRQEIIDAGLGRISKTGAVVDRFRDRLIFPIRDEKDCVVGFIGRRNPSLDRDRNVQVPKYLNSPDTALFSKGRQLYGLSEARNLLVRGALPVIVEGPVDALAVTVGTGGRAVGLSPLGVALTRAQARQLDTVIGVAGRDVVIALDADPAGQAAAVRAFGVLTECGADPRAAQLPDSMDPADVNLVHGPADLFDRLLTAEPMIEQVTEAAIACHTNPWDWVETRLAALKDAAELVGSMSPTLWGREIVRLSRRLDLDLMTVQAEVLKASNRVDDAFGRFGNHDYRDDLDRGQLIARSPAEFASDSHPHQMTTVRAEAPIAGDLPGADGPEIGRRVGVGR